MSALALAMSVAGIIPGGGEGLVVSGTRAVDDAPAVLLYTMTGTLLGEGVVPAPPGIESFTPRDVAVDRLGQVHMMVSHTGFSGNLSLCSFNGSTWSHVTVPDWSLQGVTYYGGIGANDDYIFCPDQNFGSDGTTGIVRFPVQNPAAYQHFPTGNFHTVTVGLNGLVYGADRNGNCWIFHPVTMERLADLGFGKIFRGDSVVDLCVDQHGNIFTIDLGGDVNRFDPFGNFIAELQDVGPTGDIEVRRDGTLVIGLADQRVLLGTTALQGFTEFATNFVNDPAGQIRNHLCFSTYAALPVPGPPQASITGLTVSESGVDIRFQRFPGVDYELSRSSTLAPPWTALPLADSGTGVEGLFHVMRDGDTSTYFRITSRFATP